MATALAPPPVPAAPARRRGVALRVARGSEDLDLERGSEDLDLDATLVDAFGPHAIADARDAHLADVVSLDAVRARRRNSARVRRNRVRAVLLAVGLAVALALGAGSLGGGADAEAPDAARETVVVQPGQTLWDVAASITPAGQDVRATVQQIRDLNGLAGGPVPAWTPLVLPAD